jgi:hypothetical protein
MEPLRRTRRSASDAGSAFLLTYERIAFPQDFSVIHALLGQLRARPVGVLPSGEAA